MVVHALLLACGVAAAMQTAPLVLLRAAVPLQRGAQTQMQLGRNRWQEAQDRRKEDDRARYAKIAAAKEAAEQKRLDDIEAEQQAKRKEAERKAAEVASYQDSFDYFQPGVAGQGRMGQANGGVTRAMLRDSEKTNSPALAADEQLQLAVRDAGKYSVDASRAMLEHVIAQARAVGVRESLPNMKKAVALLATLERAEQAAAEAQGEAAAEADPQADAMCVSPANIATLTHQLLPTGC